uniref:Uncharacterized protein n=1 Tax=Trichuris muris TaxID=70415 RepID=A0A5S6QRP7_TRIMR
MAGEFHCLRAREPRRTRVCYRWTHRSNLRIARPRSRETKAQRLGRSPLGPPVALRCSTLATRLSRGNADETSDRPSNVGDRDAGKLPLCKRLAPFFCVTFTSKKVATTAARTRRPVAMESRRAVVPRTCSDNSLFCHTTRGLSLDADQPGGLGFRQAGQGSLRPGYQSTGEP